MHFPGLSIAMDPAHKKPAILNAESNFDVFCQYAERQLLDAYRQAGFDPDRYPQTKAECKVMVRFLRMILIGFSRLEFPASRNEGGQVSRDADYLTKLQSAMSESLRRHFAETRQPDVCEVSPQSLASINDLLRTAVQESCSSWSAAVLKALPQNNPKVVTSSGGSRQSWRMICAATAFISALIIFGFVWIDIRMSAYADRDAAQIKSWSEHLLAKNNEEHKITRDRYTARPRTDILYRRLPAGSLQTWIPDPDHPEKGSWEFSTIKEAPPEPIDDVELRSR